MYETSTDSLATALRRELLRLAAREDDLAATQAAQVPYWAPHPPSVQGHRTAATALRTRADQLIAANAGGPTAWEVTT
jgi:hypothetical protein